MPRYIKFNGQTLYKPGALSRVTASPNRRTNLGTTGIVALIGEADGGEQGIHTFTDPLQIKGALVSGPLADAAAIVFDPSNDPVIPGGPISVVAYKVNAGTQAAIKLPSESAVLTSTAAAASSATVINWTGGGLTVNAHTGRWLKLGTGATAQYRRIASNTATAVTVTPAFLGDPTAFTGLATNILANQMNLTSRQYGIAGNQVSVELELGLLPNSYVVTLSDGAATEQSPWIGGESYFNLRFVGGPLATNGSGVITAAAANGTTITYTAPGAVGLDAFANYILEVNTPSFGLLRRPLAATSNPAIGGPGALTLTLASGYAFTSEQVAVLVGQTATVYAVTAGVGSFTGANGVCTGLTTTVTQVPASGADDLSLTFSSLGLSTLGELAEYINANFNYEASVGEGISPDTPISEMDFGSENTNVDIRSDHLLSSNITNLMMKGMFRRDLQTLINWINNGSTLATAVRSSVATNEGSEPPRVTGGVASLVRDVPIYFVGGTRGTSTNSNWQTGFDTLRDYRASQIVPIISEDLANLGQGSTATLDSVCAQLLTHVQQCNGQYKNERGAFVGVVDTDLLARARSFNSRDVQVTFQGFTVMGLNGSLTAMPEWSSAVIAAGMRAGALGESLTRKLPRVTAISIDPLAGLAFKRDFENTLLENGVLFAETIPSGAVRWVRDITTYLNDDLETSIDGQTRDVVRFIAYDLRTFIEDTFTGQRVINASAGTPSTITAVRTQAIARLTEYTNQQLLIISQDPLNPSVTVPGFDRVRVTLDGSLLQLSCRIFPTVAINFETLDITTEIPLLTAGA